MSTAHSPTHSPTHSSGISFEGDSLKVHLVQTCEHRTSSLFFSIFVLCIVSLIEGLIHSKTQFDPQVLFLVLEPIARDFVLLPVLDMFYCSCFLLLGLFAFVQSRVEA